MLKKQNSEDRREGEELLESDKRNQKPFAYAVTLSGQRSLSRCIEFLPYFKKPLE